ncbi:hypothetical protein [Cetobacterium sp.]|uniref:hypothetical protein n=1 Tax=Cetobacterium sp. TaxID=2071632 RepID=UPI003EE4BE10
MASLFKISKIHSCPCLLTDISDVCVDFDPGSQTFRKSQKQQKPLFNFGTLPWQQYLKYQKSIHMSISAMFSQYTGEVWIKLGENKTVLLSILENDTLPAASWWRYNFDSQKSYLSNRPFTTNTQLKFHPKQSMFA